MSKSLKHFLPAPLKEQFPASVLGNRTAHTVLGTERARGEGPRTQQWGRRHILRSAFYHGGCSHVAPLGQLRGGKPLGI